MKLPKRFLERTILGHFAKGLPPADNYRCNIFDAAWFAKRFSDYFPHFCK